MTNYACGFATRLDPRTAAYHRAHRVNHLEVFPRVDLATRESLDALVAVFEQREESARLEAALEVRS